MTNIWGFLIQTLNISLVAGFLWLIKYLFMDKLSPRWQYGIWGLLVVRMLVPMPNDKIFFLPISVWIEVLKGRVESAFSSAYGGQYDSLKLEHVIPMIQKAPQSFTDWIFVIYILGVVLSLLWYIASLMRLRVLLRRGERPDVELQHRIKLVCSKFGLKSCKAVCVKGLPTAFVCGGFSPILALPAEKEIDEKVILHELLHLKYHDELQSMVWCIFRCLHWCNPFMQYIFNRIENDMEALCDQRVLERLEGEERRAYGNILLDMASQKYARVPGTSSISNGGKNISKRIASIVRFQKYPKGMMLVSICVAIILFIPIFQGEVYAYDFAAEKYGAVNNKDLEYCMALTRVNRCTTVAGAIDTYAKGLIKNNGFCIATASPLSKQAEIEAEMRENHITRFGKFEDSPHDIISSGEPYRIYNLQPSGENCYEALLAFQVLGFYREDGSYCKANMGSEDPGGTLLIPIEVRYEDAWVVEETGERIEALHSINEFHFAERMLPYQRQYVAEGETGRVVLGVTNYYRVNNTLTTTNNFWGQVSFGQFDSTMKRDAEFEVGDIREYYTYIYHADENGNQPKYSVGIHYIGMDSLTEKVEFSEVEMTGNGGGSSSDGDSWQNVSIRNNDQGNISGNGGAYISPNPEEQTYPMGYRIRIYWDGEIMEELTAVETDEVLLETEELTIAYNAKSRKTVYADPELKKEFKEKVDAEYTKVEDFTYDWNGMEEMFQAYLFAEDEQKEEYASVLIRDGFYPMEEVYTGGYGNVKVEGTTLLEPAVLYNANEETWFVIVGGILSREDENFISIVHRNSDGELSSEKDSIRSRNWDEDKVFCIYEYEKDYVERSEDIVLTAYHVDPNDGIDTKR